MRTSSNDIFRSHTKRFANHRLWNPGKKGRGTNWRCGLHGIRTHCSPTNTLFTQFFRRMRRTRWSNQRRWLALLTSYYCTARVQPCYNNQQVRIVPIQIIIIMCGMFNEAFSNSDFKAYDLWVINWKGCGRNLQCSNLRYDPTVSLQRPKKGMKDFSQYSRFPGRYLNLGFSRYETRLLLTWTWRSVIQLSVSIQFLFIYVQT
jgi:hypothetical protein